MESTHHTLLFLGSPDAKFWGSIVIVMVLGVAYVANKITRGITIGYHDYQIASWIKNSMQFLHLSMSLILALALPNNLLNEFGFFRELYKEDERWIAGTSVILLFLLVIVIGVTFTLCVRITGVSKTETEKP